MWADMLTLLVVATFRMDVAVACHAVSIHLSFSIVTGHFMLDGLSRHSQLPRSDSKTL